MAYDAPTANLLSDTTADGERVLLRDLIAGKATIAIRDLDGTVLRETTFDGTSWAWSKDYVYRDGALLVTVGYLEGIRHHHLDHLGTPRLISNRTGESESTRWRRAMAAAPRRTTPGPRSSSRTAPTAA